ncbi:Type-1 restriction enzyme R protein [Spiroplasma sp. JKS002669]|uniref:type I restriction endonuclease subunit R n=1 Tax=Spiroplasma attinicola TaxID=2904537 RepID=UPI0020C1115A|nr:HsdR family type I site-specific deoxyribonuclease [Spiroplasma sp. JKS002669]MCL6428913.1 Type-1 restriction enzyme R protein [Spiroplasma sp. JKS002669]
MKNEDYTNEYDVEKKFIEVITTNWYRFNSLSSYEELLLNFREKINLINKDVLNNTFLTDSEFNEIVVYLEKQSIFEASQLLRNARIDIIKRNGHTLYLKLVDVNDIEKNNFEVAHQISVAGKYSGRFDVTLLINGIPFVQIELKKPGVEINQAFNQVLRYKRDNNYMGLFNFVQLFVISNEQNTKYFANNDLDVMKMKSNSFFWLNKNNKLMNSLYEFEENFLFCPFLFKVVFEYMIDSKQDKKLYVMRPYQIYAFEALKKICLKDEKNGYCFHSTGSGKTLTSFKFAFEMSQKKEIDKVFFLVDRKDLDDKTIDDFNSYMSSSIDDFTNIKKSNFLIKDIKNSSKKLIISTINKLAYILKGKVNELKEYKNKKIIFIFDECHRSQAGQMRKLIQDYFTNALYYGFTGTPIFNEEDAKNENAKLTSLYFNKPVHTYTLKEAIGDRNVLPLCIDYIKTVKIRDETVLLDKTVQGINYEEALLDDKRCNLVIEDVLKHFEQKTVGRRYNAIFACQSISLLIKYYDLLVSNKNNLKIAAIYSYNPNEEVKENDNLDIAKDKMVEIIEEYNRRIENNSNFNLTIYNQYERDVINNFRNKNLDILLVVDKCLTGMDFKRCNTLYLDKSMKMHGLIQAISRTIRVYDDQKICGNIICYQTSKKTMDTALAHFNNDQDVYNDVTLEPLKILIEKLNDAYENSLECHRKISSSKSEINKVEFVKAFRELMHFYNKIKNYVDFNINNTKMKMKSYFNMQSSYKDIYIEIKPDLKRESILNDIDFEINLLSRVNVNFDYLVELLKNYQNEHKNKKGTKNSISKINKLILEINDKSKQKLIRKFVDSFMNENEEGLYSDPINKYEQFINYERNQEITKISKKYNIDRKKLEKIIGNYSFYQDDVELNRKIMYLNKDNKNMGYKEILNMSKNLPIDIKTFFNKYDAIIMY